MSYDSTSANESTTDTSGVVVRRGLQAVFLSKLSQQSVTHLLEVLKDYSGAVEIAFAPHFQARASKQYSNAERIVNELTNANKSVHLPIQLGFHDSGTALPTTDLYRRRVCRAARLNEFLVSEAPTLTGGAQRIIDLPNMKITVSPSLEDTFVSFSEFQLAA